MAVRWRKDDADRQIAHLAADLRDLQGAYQHLEAKHRKVVRERDRLRQEVASLQARLAKATATIREYAHQLFGHQSERGAVPGEEKLAPGAPEGSGSGPDGSPKGSGSPGKRKRGGQPGHRGTGRRILADLPHVVKTLTLPEAQRQCAVCGTPYKPLPGAFAISLVLNWAVQVFYTRYLRQKYVPACGCKGTPRILTAPAPAKVIRKGLLSAQAIARICVEKFWWGRPLHRLLAALALEVPQLPLSAGGATGMLKRIGPLLEPLDAAIRAYIKAQTLLAADESTATVHCPEDEPERKPGHRPRWWTWCFKSKHAVAFVNDQSRGAKVLFSFFGWDPEHPPTHPLLILLTDCYSSYKTVVAAGFVVSAYCWAHIRRRFLKAALTRPSPAVRRWAETWRKRIATLYRLDEVRRKAVPDSAAWQAADQALRVHVAAIHNAAEGEACQEDLVPAQAAVVNSLLEHWAGLTIFLDHPQVTLDNNEVERILRGPIIGRKNYLYFGNLWSARLAAMLWTILATADRNELNPLTYLTAYLQACADNGGRPLSGSELDRFLPWALAPEDRAAWSRPLPPEPPANLIPGTPPPRQAKLRLHPRVHVPAPAQEVDTS